MHKWKHCYHSLLLQVNQFLIATNVPSFLLEKCAFMLAILWREYLFCCFLILFSLVFTNRPTTARLSSTKGNFSFLISIICLLSIYLLSLYCNRFFLDINPDNGDKRAVKRKTVDGVDRKVKKLAELLAQHACHWTL